MNGEVLKSYRKAKGITQEEIAKICGVKRENVSLWENKDRTIPAKHIVRIAEYFDVSVDELIGLNFPKVNKKIELLAKENDREAIFRKTKEERAELITAISHFEEYGVSERYATSEDIFKEIADVEIMCEQLKIELNGFEAVKKYKAEKIERQLERFGLTGKAK